MDDIHVGTMRSLDESMMKVGYQGKRKVVLKVFGDAKARVSK